MSRQLRYYGAAARYVAGQSYCTVRYQRSDRCAGAGNRRALPRTGKRQHRAEPPQLPHDGRGTSCAMAGTVFGPPAHDVCK